MPETEIRKPSEKEKGLRVSCPACGHFVFRFREPVPTENLNLESQCRSCHRSLSVVLNVGRLSVAIL